eukprot:ctg_7600.g505
MYAAGSIIDKPSDVSSVADAQTSPIGPTIYFTALP